MVLCVGAEVEGAVHQFKSAENYGLDGDQGQQESEASAYR